MHYLEFHHFLKRADEQIREAGNSYPFPAPKVELALRCLEEAQRIQNEVGTTIEDLFPRIRRLSIFFTTAPNERVQSLFRAYLFQTQHYNADFNSSECERFEYPLPFYQIQSNPGYVRSDFNSMRQAAYPWIRDSVCPYISKYFSGIRNPSRELERHKKRPKDDPTNFIMVTTSFSEEILKFDFLQSRQDVRLLNLEEKDNPKDQIPYFSPDSRESFIFQFLAKDLDISVIWGARWNKKGELVLTSPGDVLGQSELFGILRKMGAVPDRVTVSKLLGSCHKLDEYSTTVEEFPLCRSVLSKSWIERIEAIKSVSKDYNSGESLYREALVRWHDSFFLKYKLVQFAESLLNTQVVPWMGPEAGLIELAKAYQNCCEIVYLCIEAHPDYFSGLSLKASMSKVLGNRNTNAVGLFPYATTALSHIISGVIQEFSSCSIACVSQAYFETLIVLEHLEKSRKVSVERCDTLEKLTTVPDILVVEIHPNNATRDILYQNNVEEWVDNHFSKGARFLTLMLDITMNFFSDLELQKLLNRFLPYTNDGRLKLHLVMSAAKLIQLGADNFSGGIAVSFGVSSTHFPTAVSSKEVFYSLLLRDFLDLNEWYIQLVRVKVGKMYSRLGRLFDSVNEYSLLKKENGIRCGFSAMGVTLNGDQDVPYLALHFSSLFKELAATDRQRKIYPRNLHKMIIEIAEIRGLPLTRRQSFGFSLSSLVVAEDKFRLSIGIESEDQLKAMATLLRDVNCALSVYTGACSLKFDLAEFISKFKAANEDVFGNREISFSLPVRHSQSGEDETEWMLVLKDGKLSIPNQENQLVWTIPAELIDLIFIRSLGLGKPWIRPSSEILGINVVEGVFERSSDNRRKQPVIRDSFSGIEVFFRDRFSLKSGGVTYSQSKVFVLLEELGKVPVSVQQLRRHRREWLYYQCVNSHMAIEHSQRDGSVLLTFPSPNENKERDEDSYCEITIDGLTLEQSLRPEKHVWSQEPLEIELGCMRYLGRKMSFFLGTEWVDFLLSVKKISNFKHVVRGIFAELIDTSEERSLSKEEQEEFKRLFSDEEFAFLSEEGGIDHWLSWMVSLLEVSPDEKDRVLGYVNAFFPILKRRFAEPKTLLDFKAFDFVLALKKLSVQLGGELADFVSSLEESLLDGQLDCHSIGELINFFVRYPLENTTQERFLQSVEKIDREKKRDWMQNPDFSFYDHPREMDVLDFDWLFFDRRDRKQLVLFLEETGCLQYGDLKDEKWGSIFSEYQEREA